MVMFQLSRFFKANSSPVIARLQRSAHCLGVLVALVISTNCGLSIDAAVVSDSADNYNTFPDTSLHNVGAIAGFSNWTVFGAGTAVSTVYSGVNTWLLNKAGGAPLSASRTFDSALGIGDTFSVVDFAITNTSANATGINLNINGSQAARLEWGANAWFFEPGPSGTTGNELSGTLNLTSDLRMDFTRTSASGYRLDFYHNGAIVSAATQTGALVGGSSAINGFSFTLREPGPGASFEAQSISIVPEPSAYAMLSIGGLTAAAAAIRRRRRRRRIVSAL